MAKHRAVSKQESAAIRDLQSRLGERGLRTLLVSENPDLAKPERVRILSKERLSNLASGSGKLTDAEAERLAYLRGDPTRIRNLQSKGKAKGQKDYQTNRAIRSWIEHGREKGAASSKDEIRAIKALRFLGVPIGAGKFYKRKVAK